MFDPQPLTPRDLIRTVADRFEKMYTSWPQGQWPWQRRTGRDPFSIIARLRALDLETATEAEVDAATGDPGWCRVGCEGCGDPVTSGMTISEGIALCPACLSAAVAAARAAGILTEGSVPRA